MTWAVEDRVNRYKSSSCSSLCLSNFTAVQLHCCPLSWLSPNFRGLSPYLRGCPLLAYLSSFMTVLKLPSCSPIDWLSATAREPLKVFFYSTPRCIIQRGVNKNCQLGHISWKVLIGNWTLKSPYMWFFTWLFLQGSRKSPIVFYLTLRCKMQRSDYTLRFIM
jgi:hypothetical protein